MTLKERVIEEAINLKKHAYPEELGRLDIESINPSSVYNCIYGQMTGDCNSKRALELIQKCCSNAYKSYDSEEITSTDCNLPHSRIYYYFWSPIEKFIYMTKYGHVHRKNIEIIVKFLQGKRKTLRFLKT